MKLADYLSESGLSATKLAARLGVALSTVTRIAAGQRKPSLKVALDIARETNGRVQPSDLGSSEEVDAEEAA